MGILRCRKSLSRRATRQRRCHSQLKKRENKPKLDYRRCRHNRGRPCCGRIFLVAAFGARRRQHCAIRKHLLLVLETGRRVPRLPVASAVPEKSIAVLPFENLSERKGERFLH